MKSSFAQLLCDITEYFKLYLSFALKYQLSF